MGGQDSTVKEADVMRRPKVLIFLTFDYPVVTGTTLWTKHFLENMTRVSNMDFVVVFSGPAANREFVHTVLGCDHIFVPFRPSSILDGNTGVERTIRTVIRVWNILLEKYYYWNERLWRKQRHVDAALATIVREKQPDLVILGGISAAFCAPSVFTLKTPCCLISLNNEISIYKEVKSKGGRAGMSRIELWLYRHFNWVSNIRVARHINSVYKQCAGIVTLTQNDMPTTLPSHVVRAVIPPVLNRSDPQWSCRRARCVLFVGNMFVGTMMHYPNRLSIQWICSCLAPELSRIDDKVRINIIGATADQVPSSWHCLNINFMGRANERELVHQMITADLFVAPIANNYGAKLKLAECVAHGMPFVATEGAMSGLPFLDFMPRIHLNQPNAAARLIVEYMNKPEELTKLSQSIVTRAQQARMDEEVAWQKFLRRSVGMMVGEGKFPVVTHAGDSGRQAEVHARGSGTR